MEDLGEKDKRKKTDTAGRRLIRREELYGCEENS